MKNLSVAIFLLTATTSFAQDESKPSRWYFDLTAGVTQSKVSGPAMDDYFSDMTSSGSLNISSRTGVDISLAAKREFGNHLHFKTGLQYTQRGATLENTRYVTKPMASSDYLGVPLTFGLHTTSYSSNKFGLFVEAGFAYLFNVVDKSSSWVDEKYSTLDFLLETGADFGISPNLSLGVRYKYMKDLTRSYVTAVQLGNLVDHDYYDWFYSSNTFSVSMRWRLSNN